MFFWEGKCVGEREKRKVRERERVIIGRLYARFCVGVGVMDYLSSTVVKVSVCFS